MGRTSLVVQWLRLPLKGAQVQSLVRELRPYKQPWAAPTFLKKKTEGGNGVIFTESTTQELGLLFPPVQMTAVSSRVTSFKKKTGQCEEYNCPLISCLKSLESYVQDEFHILLYLTCTPAWRLQWVWRFSAKQENTHTSFLPSPPLFFLNWFDLL